MKRYIFILFPIFIWSCSSTKPIKNSFNRYNGSSFIDFLQDLSFLNIQGQKSKNSDIEITFCISNPYTCTSKFFFINRDKQNEWMANSFKYKRCTDTANIEKVKIKIDNKWDSIFKLIDVEKLFEIHTQEFYAKQIPRNKMDFNHSGQDINYAFLIQSNTTSNNIEINAIEEYLNHYKKTDVDISGFEKLNRLKYLFSLLLDFNTDFNK